MIQVNLLPWREQARQLKKTRLMVLAGVFAGLAFLIILGLNLYLSSLVRAQERLNDYLRTEMQEGQSVLASGGIEKSGKNVIVKKLKFINDLHKQNYRLINFLSELIKVVPNTISINKITRTGNNITIAGVAKSDADITGFMQELSTANIFTQPVLTDISADNANPGRKIFEVDIVQKE